MLFELFLVTGLLFSSPAHAEPSKNDKAEYIRLSQEMERLAQRNHWAGVERSYTGCLSTGVEMTFEDHRYGAIAAKSLGDMGSAHRRYKRAHELREEREMIDSMWEIDQNYGNVTLQSDLGTAELVVAQMPFNPDQKRALEFAMAKIEETGSFDGMLPKGEYTFGGLEVDVVPGVFRVQIDLRTDEFIERMEAQAARDARKKRK